MNHEISGRRLIVLFSDTVSLSTLLVRCLFMSLNPFSLCRLFTLSVQYLGPESTDPSTTKIGLQESQTQS